MKYRYLKIILLRNFFLFIITITLEVVIFHCSDVCIALRDGGVYMMLVNWLWSITIAKTVDNDNDDDGSLHERHAVVAVTTMLHYCGTDWIVAVLLTFATMMTTHRRGGGIGFCRWQLSDDNVAARRVACTTNHTVHHSSNALFMSGGAHNVNNSIGLTSAAVHKH